MSHPHRSAEPVPRPSTSAVFLVFAGGVLGAYLSVEARSSLHHVLPGAGEIAFALALAIVNICGAGLLGLLTGLIPFARSRARQFVGTGLLGSFTSFSAIGTTLFPAMGSVLHLHGDASSAVNMQAHGFRSAVTGMSQFDVPSLLIAIGSLVAGVGAAWLGLRTGSDLRLRHEARLARLKGDAQ